MFIKYYDSISEWIVDLEPDAPATFLVSQINAMGKYTNKSEGFIESLILGFCRTGHLRWQSDGIVKRLPSSYWDAPLPIEYHDFSSW